MAEYDEQLRIIVTGSRTWNEQGTVMKKLMAAIKAHFFGLNEPTKEELEAIFPQVTIVHGGAKGADSIAHEFANKYRMKTEVFKADWDKHGKQAGPIRNKEMLYSKPRADLVLAFVSDNESRGTQGIIDLAKKLGITVAVIDAVRG